MHAHNCIGYANIMCKYAWDLVACLLHAVSI